MVNMTSFIASVFHFSLLELQCLGSLQSHFDRPSQIKMAELTGQTQQNFDKIISCYCFSKHCNLSAVLFLLFKEQNNLFYFKG